MRQCASDTRNDPRSASQCISPDLADEMLRGQVEAERFVSGELYEIAEPVVPLHSARASTLGA